MLESVTQSEWGGKKKKLGLKKGDNRLLRRVLQRYGAWSADMSEDFIKRMFGTTSTSKSLTDSKRAVLEELA